MIFDRTVIVQRSGGADSNFLVAGGHVCYMKRVGMTPARYGRRHAVSCNWSQGVKLYAIPYIQPVTAYRIIVSGTRR